MKKFGVIGHIDRPNIKKITELIIDWANDNSVDCQICSDLARISGVKNAVSNMEIGRTSDVIISLGGDGSMLSSAQIAGPNDIPVLGINLGSLGFLTEVSEKLVNEALERLKNDDFSIEERMMLEVQTPQNKQSAYHALNDIVFDHGDSTNLVQMDLYSNDLFICSYDADGIIIASPTGSTAYSLSVGGPILNPLMDAIVVSPISPHTLTLRPIVFPPNDIITIKTESKEKKLRISADGQIIDNLEIGQTANIRQSRHKLKLVKLNGGSFYEILRTKLHWGARPLLNS